MQISGHKTRDVFGHLDIVAGADLEAAVRIDNFFRAGSGTISVTEDSTTSRTPR